MRPFYGAFTHDLSFDTNNKYARNRYISFNIPLHWWAISGFYTNSSYLNSVVTTNTTFSTSGSSSVSAYKVQRIIFRNRTTKLGISADMNLKSTVSFIEDVKNEVGSRELSVATFSLNHSVNNQWGYLSSTLSFAAGLSRFGDHKDMGPFDDFTPRVQYQKYVLEVNYYKGFNLKQQRFLIQSYLFGQFSKDPLFSSEQISIGGAYSVRGFRDKSILGDDGFYLTNTFGYYFPNVMKELGLNKVLTKTQILIGYDIGFVRQKGGQIASFGEGEGSLSGITLGLRFSSKALQYDITYAQSLKTEAFIDNANVLYFNITLRLI